MKKFYLAILLVCTSVFTVYSQTGVIRELTGDVQLKGPGSSDFSPAQVGTQLSQDTIVSTGFRSSALIAVGSTVISVRPLTRLSLAEISSSQGTENLNVNLQAGRVRVEVAPPAGLRANVSVQAPSATASVRGTSFEMDTRNLNVSSGSVNWQDLNGFSTAVTLGFSSSIDEIGMVVDPVQLAAEELSPTGPVGSGEAGESLAASDSTNIVDFDLGLSW